MKRLKDYIEVILEGKHTGEEWRQINKDVDQVYKNATDEEKKEFEISGAADTLEMLIEYVE